MTTIRCGLITRAAGQDWACNRTFGHSGPCSILIDEALEEPKAEQRRANYVAAPHYFNLNLACVAITQAFGTHCYLVGSALTTKQHRDVDVRLILPDEEFAKLFRHGAHPFDARWTLMCVSISAWLSQQSGLPVDFQIQQESAANAEHSGKRHPLGLLIEREQTNGAAQSSDLAGAASALIAFWDQQPEANLSVVERDELTELESRLRQALKGKP